MGAEIGFRKSWPKLHSWIEAITTESSPRQLDEENLLRWVRYYALNAMGPESFIGGVASEFEKLPAQGSAPPSSCGAVNKALLADGEDPRRWPLNECRYSTALESPHDELVSGLKQGGAMTIEQFKRARLVHPEIHFYVYAGLKDTLVPIANFEGEVTELGDLAAFHAFEESGHEGYSSEDLVWSDLNLDH